MPLRNYSNTAPPQSLGAGVTAAATTLTVGSTAGYPDAPFLLGMERGTANEEVVLCTAKDATTFTVERGYDGTTAKAHDIGTLVEHTVAAIDFREATRSELNAQFSLQGTLTVRVGKGRFPMPFDAVLLGVRAVVDTAPTGSGIIVDLNINGTSAYTTPANRPTIAATRNEATETVPDVTTVVEGDYLTVDIDQVGSTAAGADLTVVVRYRRA